MQRQYSRLRETVFDLYIERDTLPWYLKPLAVASSWLALAGYVVFALVFTSGETNLQTTRTTLTALAATFLLVGYVGVAAVAYYSHSLLFRFDAVLLPILTSSFMGLVITVLNHALHKHFPIPSQAYIYIPLVTAGVTTVASAGLALFVHRKMAKIKSLDTRRRQHTQRWDRDPSLSYGDAASTTELLSMNHHIPEDEAQRQQLLRLLLSREAAQSPAVPAVPSTYQISLPPENSPLDGLQVVPSEVRLRSESLRSSPSKWSVLGKSPRYQSPTLESFKAPRERRREEIERASVLLTPGLESGWTQTLEPPSPSPAQTLGGSTRYA